MNTRPFDRAGIALKAIERLTGWWRSFYTQETAPDGMQRLKGTGALLTALTWQPEMSSAQLCQRLQTSEDRLALLVFDAERKGLISSRWEPKTISHLVRPRERYYRLSDAELAQRRAF